MKSLADNVTSWLEGFGLSGDNATYNVDGLTYRVEVADDPTGPWSSGSSLLEQIGIGADNGDGTETVKVLLKQIIPGTARKFMRLALEAGP